MVYFQNLNQKKKQVNNIDFSSISTTNKELNALRIYNDYIYARLFSDYLKVYNNTLDKVQLENLILYLDNNLNQCKVYNKKNCDINKYNLNINLDNKPETTYKKIQLNLDQKNNITWAEINGKIKDESFNYFTKVENEKFDSDNLTNPILYNNKYLKNLKDKTFFINGKLFVDEPIIVPKNYNLKIESGAELILTKNHISI